MLMTGSQVSYQRVLVRSHTGESLVRQAGWQGENWMPSTSVHSPDSPGKVGVCTMVVVAGLVCKYPGNQ